MVDYREGIKKDVAEVKFLIHDLRVERFINELIHYQVTLNTDLEIYSAEQARVRFRTSRRTRRCSRGATPTSRRSTRCASWS
jgi:hypothetical protein